MYQPDALPRRPFLGIELRASAEPGGGVEVLRVVAESTAARAGMEAGDRLLAVDGEPVTDPAAVAARARTLVAGNPIAFEVSRAGARRALAGVAVPLPIEQIEGAEVELGHVVAGGHRLRTLITTPAAASSPSTAVLHLPGLGGASCELSSDPDEPRRLLLEGWTRAGLLTMRLERSGVGDSEGPPFRETDLFTEIAAYRAALQALAGRPGVARVVIFGHSVGGMIAPLLAGEGAGVAAVVVFGTSLLRWHDCLLTGARRQRTLAGLGGEELERAMSAWAELLHRVLREGATPSEVLADSPHLAWLEGSVCHGETLHGRHVAFFQQMERLDLPALWRTVACPVLVLHGEHDWVCAPEEGRAVAEAAGGQYVELPGVGHDLRRHESLSRSFAEPRAGRWDGSVVSAMTPWIEGGPMA